MIKHKEVKPIFCLKLLWLHQWCLQTSLVAKATTAQTREMKMSTIEPEWRRINVKWRVHASRGQAFILVQKILTINEAINQMNQLQAQSKRRRAEEWAHDTEEWTTPIIEKCQREIYRVAGRAALQVSSRTKGTRSITNPRRWGNIKKCWSNSILIKTWMEWHTFRMKMGKIPIRIRLIS